jgi:hypothetical protein
MNTQKEIYNAEQSSAKNNDRMCKKYDDLNMFQVDGINDDSSSDENPMVIAEVITQVNQMSLISKSKLKNRYPN